MYLKRGGGTTGLPGCAPRANEPSRRQRREPQLTSLGHSDEDGPRECEAEAPGGLKVNREGTEALESHPRKLVPALDTGSFRKLLLVIMRSVGLKVLKNKLSEYVRLAANGETVLVTDRDRVVAELGPPREGRSPLLADAQLAEAVRRGWVTPQVLPPGGLPPRAPVASLRVLLQELEKDREGG